MLKHIPYNVKSISTNTVSSLFDDINNKWSKITNKMISLPTFKSKQSNKRIRSPKINSKWIEQSEKLFKRKKN